MEVDSISVYRIAVTVTDGSPVAMSVVKDVLGNLGELTAVPMPHRPLSSDELNHFQEVFSQFDAAVVRSGIFGRPLLMAAARRLKVMAVHGAGVDQIDVDAATELGIAVTNAPGMNANAVAELTVGLMLSLLRRIPDSDRRVRFEGGWRDVRPVGRELRGKIVGLVGLGAVGKRVAQLVQAFRARVLAYDPYVLGQVPADVSLVGFEALAKDADVLSLHTPLTPETRNLLNAKNIESFKRGVLIVNTSRGDVIDEAALEEALRTGQVGGVALDVLADEPPTSRRPIFDIPNVIVTPHMGGSTEESLQDVARLAAEEIGRFLRGEPLRYLVNREVIGHARLSES